jgi:Zn-dependent peptidase ImmA (M78 family)
LANNTNTTKIGDEFETKSLDIIRKVIEKDQLAVNPQYIKIYPKQGYYSNDRKKNIIFDLTIEVWPPGADRYVMIYIIECKDYKNRVPVSKMEDFRDKIRQVAGVNVKGIFISNSPLQEGAFNLAQSAGIMFIQGESSNDYEIILHKTNRKKEQDKIQFVTETINSALIENGVEHLEKVIDKYILDVFKPISDTGRTSYNIDKLSKEDIEKIANEELIKINPRIMENGYFNLSVNKLTDHIRSYGIQTTYIKNHPELLGICNIKHQGIAVNISLKGTPRELFILAHEFGHYMLHQKLMIGQGEYDRFTDSTFSFRKGKYTLENPKHWIEWQANYFAECLVLPRPQFKVWAYRCMEDQDRYKKKFYVDDQLVNQRDFSDFVNKMAIHFNVTKTSIIYRLNELELIDDNTTTRSIGQIISEYSKDLLI